MGDGGAAPAGKWGFSWARWHDATGSGTGGFDGAKGRLDFKDIIGDPVTFVCRGHLQFK